MAPGYVIAAFCELTGLLGLLAGFVMIRAERRAKAIELRGALRSGFSASVMPASVAPSRWRMTPVAAASLPATPLRPRDPASVDSAARSALLRRCPA